MCELGNKIHIGEVVRARFISDDLVSFSSPAEPTFLEDRGKGRQLCYQ